MHVKLADESVCIGPPPARDSYLNIPSLLAACEITGADAVHPGYGFLSENARFAEILERAQHRLHRPEARAYPHHGRQDRGQAHRHAAWHPLRARLAGRGRTTTTRLLRIAADIGYPAAGQGGGGRRRARHEGRAWSPTISPTRSPPPRPRPRRRSATTPSISRNISQKPRHIEIQMLGDGHGRAIHLGERDCSLQRRHQKVWEEGPSPALNAAQREEIGGDRRQGHGRARLYRRRHGRIPL